MNDEFIIQLEIADKRYRFRCKRSEEAIARRAARQINDKILQYERAYPESGLELKDLLAMVAFQLSFEDLKVEKKADASPVFDKIKGLNLELEDYLKSNK